VGIFQCCKCGCAENTACGWYNSRNSKRLTTEEDRGKPFCSACAPQEFPSGQPTKFNGKWHNIFKRTFLPLGEFKKNLDGNLEHIETGLVGNEAYAKFGRDTPY
jgi:hypothetical protein